MASQLMMIMRIVLEDKRPQKTRKGNKAMNAKFFAAIGAVALSAAVAHADVESANVVG